MRLHELAEMLESQQLFNKTIAKEVAEHSIIEARYHLESLKKSACFTDSQKTYFQNILYFLDKAKCSLEGV